MQLIESKKYLCMDHNYPDTIEVLSLLHDSGYELCLLTARWSKIGLLDELKQLELIDYFKQVLVTEGETSKEDLLLKYSETDACIMNVENIFVSDMGKDIALGNKFGFNTIAITHGFMSKERLEEYHPKIVISELSEIVASDVKQKYFSK